ncbi:hypothetical protein RJ639_044774 [Escallonia herrerae]|uniref:DNA-(apurinic or apyrimidinic site) lyase n=1 Tax=Escallonia herrerae TaxID=1293975 RepID=A0AA88WAR6_9ASTE|nr:hypothetical protein RJ639_044774 [Escallonia herrerae]
MKRQRSEPPPLAPITAAILPTPSTPPTPQTAHKLTHSKPTPTRKTISNSSKKPKKSLFSSPNWAPLNTTQSELSLPLTFPTGQTFRWRQTQTYPLQYTGVVGSHLVSLKQLQNGDVAYHFYHTPCDTNARAALLDFLNLDISLSDMWQGFSAVDSRFAELARHLGGARVLRQDPLECLVQFICSSNNNIKRITQMVDFISSLGDYLGTVEGFDFYAFPSLDRLSMVSEAELRAAGFGYSIGDFERVTILEYQKLLVRFNKTLKDDEGFGLSTAANDNKCNVKDFLVTMSRAKYIVGTMEALQSKPGGGVRWLASLRDLELQKAIDALSTLPGVGPKVAACIALFSLDQHHAIPIDTHVWQIATRHLIPELAGTRLTPKLRSYVADAFVSKYGKYAGWAQTLLFIAELPSQKALLPSTLWSMEGERNSKRKNGQMVTETQ